MLRWALLLLLLAPVAAAQSTEDLTIESHDGTDLNARLYRPAAQGDAPAILLTHGWGESIEFGTTQTYAQRFQELGYVVLAYDSRGFGASGGQVELNGPNEVKDAQALIDHIAGLDGVLLDSPGDPRIGMVGQSYAGGIQILAAAQDPRLDAIAPFATWSNLLTALAPDDVLKRSWIDLLYASGTTSSRGIPLGGTDPDGYSPDPLGGTTSKLDEWYLTATATGAPSDEMRQEVGAVRSLTPGAITVPVFLAQGWPDTLFTPDHALATFQDLRSRGIDVRLALLHGGHGGFGAYADTEPVMAALDDFFAQHLLGERPTLPPYPVLRYRYQDDAFVGDMSWPPGGSRYDVLYLTDDGLRAAPGEFSHDLIVPAAPAQCTEVSNFQGQTGEYCGQGVEATRLDLATETLAEAVEVTGTPFVTLHADTTQTEELFLFFHLEDVAPDDSATPVLSQVMPVRVPADQGVIVTPLATVSHFFEAGHRIALTIATTDFSFHGSRQPGQVTLGGDGDMLWLPVVAQDAWGDRIAPTITQLHSFGQAIQNAGNDTQMLRFSVRDGLAVGNVTVEAVGGQATLRIVEDTVKMRVVEVLVDAPCGAATTVLRAEDLAGNNATKQTLVAPCPPPTTLGPEPKDADKKSPAALVLFPVALAMALRRARA